jgi:hypothetical protein
MLNADGVRKTSYGKPIQILANVEHQMSVGCIVPKTMASTVDGKSIVPAGTALNINLMDLQVRAKAPIVGSPMNAVLLHDVDMTNVAEGGAMNGTALIWGFVNVNRLRTAEQSSIVTAAAIEGGTDKITLLKA